MPIALTRRVRTIQAMSRCPRVSVSASEKSRVMYRSIPVVNGRVVITPAAGWPSAGVAAEAGMNGCPQAAVKSVAAAAAAAASRLMSGASIP